MLRSRAGASCMSANTNTADVTHFTGHVPMRLFVCSQLFIFWDPLNPGNGDGSFTYVVCKGGALRLEHGGKVIAPVPMTFRTYR
jgi:hypothetical protein